MVQWNKVFLLSHPPLQPIHCRSLLIFTYRQQITISSLWQLILVQMVLFLHPNHLLLSDLKSRRLALPVNVIKCSWKIKELVNIQSLVFYLMQKLVPQGVSIGYWSNNEYVNIVIKLNYCIKIYQFYSFNWSF